MTALPKTTRAAAFALLLLLGAARAAHAQGQLAVRADTLFPMTGDGPIADGVVLVEDGRIEAVGPASQIDVPSGYRTIEAAFATPGLVDARATVGMTGLTNVAAVSDQLDRTTSIQPELRAFDAYNPREPLVEFVQRLGVTTVHTGHGPGALMSGQTMVVKTEGRLEEAIVDSVAMVAMTLGPQVSGNYDTPDTRAKGVALLREAFLKARRYREQRASADDENRPARDLRMEMLSKVLAGEVPALITAQRTSEIQSALRLAEEFGFELVLSGAAESYRLAGRLAAADVPVILHPTMARTGGEAENAAFTTAHKLKEAGVPVAIQSGYEAYVPKTRVVLYEAAVAAGPGGLTRREALRTVTIDAARILGVAGRVGSLEEGKDADLALFDGDPLEYTTRTCGVLVGGAVVSDECR
ncbi:MAG: amidohydrolase [Bacteroidetes bacterium QH_8_67_23]|nr:MAG: amidohydrolase [Bacteroidetes bacterium QH_8_67_23]